MRTKTEGEPLYRRVLATYSLQLIGPGLQVGYERTKSGDFERYEGLAPSLMREAEENITDLLPADYHVVIREWNDETEETL